MTADGTGLPDLSSVPGHLIRITQQVHAVLWNRHVSTQITSVQYGTMLVLAHQAGVDQRTISSLMSLDKSTVASVVERLVRRGDIARVRHRSDGRRYEVTLTDQGLEALLMLAPDVKTVQRKLLAPLSSAERRQLSNWLRKVAHRGEAPQARSAPPARDVPGGGPLPPGDLEDYPGHLIRVAEQVHTSLWRERVGSDISSLQYAILLTLHRAPGIDQRTLGEEVSMDKSTAGEVVHRLVSRGFIFRERDPRDTRRYVLSVTPVGRDHLYEAAEGVRDVQLELLLPIAAGERDDFVSLLERFRARGSEYSLRVGA